MGTSNLSTTSDICKSLGVKKHVLVYLLETSVIPEPQKIGGRRLFRDDEINFIREILERRRSVRQGVNNKKKTIYKEKTNVNCN